MEALAFCQAAEAPEVEHARQRERARHPREREHAEEERRLRERRERHLARRAHPFERRARVHGRGGDEEPREREHADEEDHVSREREERGPASEGQQERGDDGRHDGQDGPGEKHPGRRAADDEPLPEELREVEIDLEKRRPGAPGHEGLRPRDHAEKKRREDEHGGEVRDRAHHDELHASRTTSVTTM